MGQSAENDASREHYLYINMRDRGCNCGARYHDAPRDRAALEAVHAAHLASVIPPTERHDRGCAAGVASSTRCTCPIPPGKGD